ncbi:hypothetical protein [Pendulispora albinea]|uniref:Delta-60 repeat domain-containing protein n=1 Tax=Pendulispora albinea TaxID=2741071 RepID=A0ABZ2LR52_9BACT
MVVGKWIGSVVVGSSLGAAIALSNCGGDSEKPCEGNCIGTAPPPADSSGPRGELDRTFTEGAGFKRVGAPGNGYPYVRALRRAPDGSLVLVIDRDSPRLFHFSADGATDKTWGSSGVSTLDTTKFRETLDITVDRAGRTLGLSSMAAPSTKTGYVLARILPNGQIDSSFAQGGYTAPIELPSSDFLPLRVFEREDGKLLIVGHVIASGKSFAGFALVNADGSPDTAFGTGGFKTHPTENLHDSVSRLADGTIVLTEARVLIAYDSNGDPRPSFGNGGRLDYSALVPDAHVEQLTLVTAPASNGFIGCWNYGRNDGTEFGAARFGPTGSLDTTFTATGTATGFSPKGSGAPTCNTLQSAVTSRLFLAGINVLSLGNGVGWAVELGGDGGVDPTFAEGVRGDAGLLQIGIFEIYDSVPDTKARAVVAGMSRGTPFIGRIYL